MFLAVRCAKDAHTNPPITQIQKLCCQNVVKCRSQSVWTQSCASARRWDFNTHAAHLNHVRITAASSKHWSTSTQNIHNNNRVDPTPYYYPWLDETINISQYRHVKSTWCKISAAVSYLRCWSRSVSGPDPDSVRPEPPPPAAASSSSSTLRREIKQASRRSRPALCEREMRLRRARVLTLMCLISAHVL